MRVVEVQSGIIYYNEHSIFIALIKKVLRKEHYEKSDDTYLHSMDIFYMVVDCQCSFFYKAVIIFVVVERASGK